MILPLNPAALRTISIFDGIACAREPRTVIYIISRHVNSGLEKYFQFKIENQRNYFASRTRAYIAAANGAAADVPV
jgi:hypothetical protein